MRRATVPAHLAAISTLIGLFGLTIEPALARDDWRCDCSQKVDRCRARIQLEEDWIRIQSNRRECSQVVWYANGQPKTTVVLDGTEQIQWLGTGAPDIEIESCEVCADSSHDRITSGSNAAPKICHAELQTTLDTSPRYAAAIQATRAQFAARDQQLRRMESDPNVSRAQVDAFRRSLQSDRARVGAQKLREVYSVLYSTAQAVAAERGCEFVWDQGPGSVPPGSVDITTAVREAVRH